MLWLVSVIGMLVLVACGTARDPSRVSGETVREIIEALQMAEIRESYGVLAHECFTDADLARFRSDRTVERIVTNLRSSRRFLAAVDKLRGIAGPQREAYLQECRRPLHKTWAELGEISPRGQTIAGVTAERELAEGAVGLVRELLNIPAQRI